ncbi:N-6 DNA methylase, partial [Acidithiobacillus ferrooxidans F221]|uniref:Eco57I restriction-modification methylase domain-containing protein n=1 Tax=Acidithiobacillus ferrooxidans TaxID=920 RepID=UPI001C07D72E
GDLFANPAVAGKESELREANASHFAAKRFADKRKRKARILRLRDELVALLKADQMLRDPSDADRMAAWDPFDQNRHADFFDPEWMFGFSHGFDMIIGNPPYVRQEAIKDDKPRYKPHYECYNGTADLYVYFYERSFQLLNPYGVLSFITSNKWFRAKYGADLRRYMVTHSEMRQIIDFGDEAVFDALAYPTIVIATKRPESDLLKTAHNDVLALNWDSHNPAHQVAHFPEVFATEHFAVPQAELKAGGWHLESSSNRSLLDRLRKSGIPLKQFVGSRVYRGITTGFNTAFELAADEYAQLVKDDPKSADVIKPYLRGKNIKRWKSQSQDLWLIFTRRGIDINDYPVIKEYLQVFREKLEPKPDDWDEKINGAWAGRKAGSYNWYEIQDNIAYWKELELPKIVSTKISISPTFCLDVTGSYLGNTAYFFTASKEPLFILALLNSAISAFISKNVFVGKQGGFYEVQPVALELFPIPDATNLQRAVISRVVGAIFNSIAINEYERLLNGLVYELFFPEDLHAKGIRLFDACTEAGIADWPAPDETAGKKRPETVAQLGWNMHASSTANEIFHPRHPIYGMLFELQAVEVVRLIEGVA